MRFEVVDPHEGMGPAGGHESEAAAVRGEAQVPEGAPPVDELFGLRVRFEPDFPDPAPAQEQNRVPVGSEEWRGCRIGDAAVFRPLDDPQRLLHSRRIARRVREFARPVGAVAADEGDVKCVAAEREAVDGGPVVALEGGEAESPEIRSGSRPDVPGALLVKHPGDPGSVGSSR